MRTARPAALAFVLTILTAGVAGAQTTDPSKIADARVLAGEGLALHDAGKCSEALPKFREAHRLYPEATTITIHLAQCQVSVGRWVEASETYREIGSTVIPPGSPAQFQQAKEQAAAEKAQLDRRIPTLTLRVAAPVPADLRLQTDGVVLDQAWLGTARRLNPGKHHVLATASGYASPVTNVELRERENRQVQLVLEPLPAGAAPPQTAPEEIAPPPPYTTEEPRTAPPDEPPSLPPNKIGAPIAGLFGIGLGVSAGGGDRIDGGASGAASLEAWLRLRKLVIGGVLHYDLLGKGDNDRAPDSVYAAAHIGFTTTYNKKVSFWLDGGVGMRTLGDERMPAVQLAMGPTFPLGRVVRLLTKAHFGAGFGDNAFGTVGLMAGLQLEAAPKPKAAQ